MTMDSHDQARHIERIALIEHEAAKVFGSIDKAKDWLENENNALGTTPNALLETEAGAVEVRKVLMSIAYGGVV